MLIPVIFTLLPLCDDLVYSWIFFKGVDLAKHHGWPVFAQHQYFHEREKQKAMGALSPETAALNDYEVISEADFSRIMCREFPRKLIEDYLAEFPSQTDAFLASIRKPWPEMTDFLVEGVRQCEQEKGERAEAFICLGAPRFVRDAAEKLGIALIHYEWGPFRSPAYRHTAYFDFQGSVCDGEMLGRYETFQKVKDRLPVFGKKEILAFFLNDVSQLAQPDSVPEYKIGLALGYSTPSYYSAFSQLTATELLSEARRYFPDSGIAVRYHPGDPMGARLRGPQSIDSGLIDFIRSCERVACVTSNIAYEAMLWDRPSYDVGSSMYGTVGNHRLEGLQDKMASDDFLSFIAFGYLIPFEMLNNVDYIRWRLTSPGEEEVYQYHLRYYMECLGIPREVLSLPGEERLREIVRLRDAEVDIQSLEKYTDSDRNHIRIQNIRLKNALRQKQVQNQALFQQLHAVAEQSQAAAQQMEALREHNQVLSHQVQTDSELNQAIAQQAQTLREQNAEAAARNRMLTQQMEALREHNQVLSQQVQTDSEQNHEATVQIRMLTEQMQSLREHNQVLSRQVESDSEQNQALMQQMEAVRRQLAEALAENRQLQNECSSARRESEALRGTLSWRITKPLRFLGGLLGGHKE